MEAFLAVSKMSLKTILEKIQEELRETRSEIEILGIWRGMGARDESFKVMRDILSAHPDINGVFAVNDPSAFGVIAALEIAEKQDQVKIIGLRMMLIVWIVMSKPIVVLALGLFRKWS